MSLTLYWISFTRWIDASKHSFLLTNGLHFFFHRFQNQSFTVIRYQTHFHLRSCLRSFLITHLFALSTWISPDLTWIFIFPIIHSPPVICLFRYFFINYSSLKILSSLLVPIFLIKNLLIDFPKTPTLKMILLSFFPYFLITLNLQRILKLHHCIHFYLTSL